MYDYRQLSHFWQSIRPIQGSTKFAVQFNGQTIIPQDFDFIQKDGVAYIYDTRNDKLYDQYLNYYQNGTYFNSDGTPKTQVQNDNIIDIDPGNVYKHTPQDGIEYFDSDGNSLGYKKPSNEETIITIEDDNTSVKTETSSTEDSSIPNSSVNQNNAEKVKQDKPISNPDKPNNKPNRPGDKPDKPETKSNKPDINAKTQPETEVKNTPTPPEKPKYNHKKGPKVNSANITKEHVEQVKKVVKDTRMKTKKLAGDAVEAISEGVNWGKVGKVGAVVGVAALVGFGVHKHNEKEKKNRQNEPDRLTGATRKSEFWNQSYTAQMAKDISTYQYGKRMTGFIQG